MNHLLRVARSLGLVTKVTPLETTVIVMRSKERKVTKVTLGVIIKITTRIVTCVTLLFVIAKSTRREVGKVDIAVTRDIRAHDHYIDAYRLATGRLFLDNLTLDGNQMPSLRMQPPAATRPEKVVRPLVPVRESATIGAAHRQSS